MDEFGRTTMAKILERNGLGDPRAYPECASRTCTGCCGPKDWLKSSLRIAQFRLKPVASKHPIRKREASR